MRSQVLFPLFCVLVLSLQAQEKLSVVCTTETLEALAKTIGGDRLQVASLSRGVDNPHMILPTPSLMIQVNTADLLIETGLDLELWLENVLDGARNPAVRRGGPGHLFASLNIEAMEIPDRITRAEGDQHPQGNPHIWLDPANGKVMAANIASALTRLDPAGAEVYSQNLETFGEALNRAMYGDELIQLLGPKAIARLEKSRALIEFLEKNQYRGKPLIKSLGGWRGRMLPLRGKRFLAYHKSWIYLARAFDFEIAGHIEPKPGISPTPAHLAKVRRQIASGEICAIICAPYHDFSKTQTLAAEGGIRAIELPSAVGGDVQSSDYFRLFDRIVDLMLGETNGD